MRPHTNRFIRQLQARPRLLLATAIAVLVGIVLPASVADQSITRALIAWNAGTCLYILLAGIMMARSSTEKIQQRARLEDEGQHVLLGLVVVAGVASLAAIAGELGVVKETRGAIKAAHVALAGLTVLSSWAFMHLIFALHYAHDYYADVMRGRKPGLAFPGSDSPDYGDFFLLRSDHRDIGADGRRVVHDQRHAAPRYRALHHFVLLQHDRAGTQHQHCGERSLTQIHTESH
jgi:uncharacterized membrane protein